MTRSGWLSVVLSFGAIAIGIIALTGYVLGNASIASIVSGKPVSGVTALAFILLGSGLLLLRSPNPAYLWTAGYIGHDPNVIAEARRVAERYLSDPASVDVTIAGPALEIAAVNGDEALYRTIRQKLDSAPTAEVRERYATLVSQFRDPKLIAQTIDYTFSDAVRTQDLPRMIGRIFGNPEGREAIWQAVTGRWPQLQKSIPTALGGITGSLGSFRDPKAKAAIEAFFAKQPLTEGSRALRRSLESIDTCIAFRQAQEPSFKKAVAESAR